VSLAQLLRGGAQRRRVPAKAPEKAPGRGVQTSRQRPEPAQRFGSVRALLKVFADTGRAHLPLVILKKALRRYSHGTVCQFYERIRRRLGAYSERRQGVLVYLRDVDDPSGTRDT